MKTTNQSSQLNRQQSLSALGITLSIGSIVIMSGLAVFWIIQGVPFAGFGSLIGVTILGFSLTMLCIGVLAQYMGLMYEEVKQRPLYLVTESTNSINF
jgi:dolichol-phosphate mannosyltransferase